MQRAGTQVVGAIGALYSGAAYLALNVNLAAEELQAHVAVARPVAAVVMRAALPAFEVIFGTSLPYEIIGDDSEEADSRCGDPAASELGGGAGRDEALPVTGAPEHAAYALFTSGPTHWLRKATRL